MPFPFNVKNKSAVKLLQGLKFGSQIFAADLFKSHAGALIYRHFTAGVLLIKFNRQLKGAARLAFCRKNRCLGSAHAPRKHELIALSVGRKTEESDTSDFPKSSEKPPLPCPWLQGLKSPCARRGKNHFARLCFAPPSTTRECQSSREPRARRSRNSYSKNRPPRQPSFKCLGGYFFRYGLRAAFFNIALDGRRAVRRGGHLYGEIGSG